MDLTIIDHGSSKQDLDRFYTFVAKAARPWGMAKLIRWILWLNIESTQVAFDLEGVNLSRAGSIELVSLAFETSGGEKAIFLLDIGTKNKKGRKSRIAALKKILESDQIVKVVHDCRMDCDALVHIHGINVKAIHDTSVYHELISGSADVNLNDMLRYYGLPANAYRDTSIYRVNPSFWATRPLTSKMSNWASSDVDKLIVLAKRQKEKISSFDLSEAQKKSIENATTVSSMKLERGLKLQGELSPSAFIGTRGSNIRSLQRETGTMIYIDSGDGKENVWMVFYPSKEALNSVKRVMGHEIEGGFSWRMAIAVVLFAAFARSISGQQ